MSEQKKAKLVVVGIGLAMILIAVLTIFAAAKTKHYPATVTEITNTQTKTSRGTKKKYHEWVTVTFTDDSGNERTATEVHIKESVKSSLPQVGDTIQVKGKNRITEYSLTSYIGTAIALIFVGIILVVRGITYKPKTTPAVTEEQNE